MSAETKWTEGSWEVASYHTGTVKAAGQLIATVFGDDPECEPDERQAANTNLIAASPDLYEALERAKAGFEMEAHWLGLHSNADVRKQASDMRKEAEYCSDALAKARGESGVS